MTETQNPPVAAAPTPTEPATETYIAYAQKNAVLVTHVIGGQALETREITDSQPNEWVTNINWSPSGEFLAYLKYADAFTHLFYINLLDGSTPVDLGIAEESAWSSDSKQLAFVHEYELWVVSVGEGQPRQLTTHLGTSWLWGKLAFTPAGDALVAFGTRSDDMDRDGNTLFKLYKVPLDGSGANAYPTTDMPSLTEAITGRMPLALSFSPDGQKIAIVTWIYVDSCATQTAFLVGNADGRDLHELPMASLAAFGGPDQRMYFFGDNLVWTPESDGLWLKGQVKDCGGAFDIVAGPQISRVTLDGAEHQIIPGKFGEFIFGGLSLDHTGTLLGVMNTARAGSRVQILGLDGHLVLDLGEGELASLQP